MKFIVTLLVCTLTFFCCSVAPESSVRIASAANMQYAVKEIIKAFEEEFDAKCELIIGSSGKLTAQISEGAPYDIFISADTKYPAELYSKGLTRGNPEIYALGNIVLWTTRENLIPSTNSLSSSTIHKIAISNPKLAPYGRASVEILENLGIYHTVKDKLVFGESVSQTSQFISIGAAEIGFTSKSIVLSDAMNNKGRWIDIDNQFFSPIEQAAVVLKSSKNPKEAQLFYKFLFSEKAQHILTYFGYNNPER